MKVEVVLVNLSVVEVEVGAVEDPVVEIVPVDV